MDVVGARLAVIPLVVRDAEVQMGHIALIVHPRTLASALNVNEAVGDLHMGASQLAAHDVQESQAPMLKTVQ